jgi:hypothetical protein
MISTSAGASRVLTGTTMAPDLNTPQSATDELDAVRQIDGDAVAGRDAALDQCVRDAVGQKIELAIRQAPPVADDRDPAGIAPRVFGQERPKSHRGFRLYCQVTLVYRMVLPASP